MQSVTIDDAGTFTFIVSYVTSPCEFWVHPVQSGTAETVDDIMDTLEHYYTHILQPVTMSAYYLGDYSVGQLVCARFSEDERLYRAEIVEMTTGGDDDDKTGDQQTTRYKQTKRDKQKKGNKQTKGEMKTRVKVFYVDFGNSEWLDVNDVLPLPLPVKDTPGQAVQCSLVGVQPRAQAGK